MTQDVSQVPPPEEAAGGEASAAGDLVGGNCGLNHECGCHGVSFGPHRAPDVERAQGSRLLLTMGLNLLIPAVQMAGGFYAHSVALISDATHNFSDFTAIVIAYFAFLIGRRGPSPRLTFGYKRAEILAALANVAILVGASGFIVHEAVRRFQSPEAVSGQLVMAVAAVGVAGNGFSAWLLHRDAKHSLNVRGAFLHMMGDLLTSVVVLLNGAVLLFKPWYWLDPLLSLTIVVFILKNCWSILKEAATILMNATPRGLDIEKVKTYLEGFPDVCGVHYVHAWNVSASSVAFSCHLVVADQPVSRTEVLAERIREDLWRRFGIDHPVLQFETVPCGNGSLLCELSCAAAAEPESQEEKRRKAEERRVRLRAGLLAACRMLFGGMFLYAGAAKIRQPEAFAQAVFNYQILPDYWINPAALVLPWLECLVGLCVLFGFWLPGALLTADSLLAVFLGVLLFNIHRGLNVDCGCFVAGPGTGDSGNMAWSALRDTAFLAWGGALHYLLVFRRAVARRMP
ncbi:cation diffusion facilitator family transporter [Desulfoglaeba alkanexedens ALDC]|uniref:Cation diffusion facilitator family transporter n=1 Tax=Desulfoglaeba alkanexedens ALDC TaxID=980445 RepID=A0A4P8L166_9BACT|nr:cation diffusion facilitator family transporter [Desulfoglaeba alkanexedens ALDC]